MSFQSKFCSRDRSALNEATRSPIFLLQRKVWNLINVPWGYELGDDGGVFTTLKSHVDDMIEAWHNGDSDKPLHEYLGWTETEYAMFMQNSDIPDERYEEWEPRELTWDELHKMSEGAYDVPCAIFHWETDRVFLTREEAENYGKNRSYNYADGWRVYSVCAEGELEEVLKDGTEMTLKR